jgi:hypothetical protein
VQQGPMHALLFQIYQYYLSNLDQLLLQSRLDLQGTAGRVGQPPRQQEDAHGEKNGHVSAWGRVGVLHCRNHHNYYYYSYYYHYFYYYYFYYYYNYFYYYYYYYYYNYYHHYYYYHYNSYYYYHHHYYYYHYNSYYYYYYNFYNYNNYNNYSSYYNHINNYTYAKVNFALIFGNLPYLEWFEKFSFSGIA